jgi:hypothetical protein
MASRRKKKGKKLPKIHLETYTIYGKRMRD